MGTHKSYFVFLTALLLAVQPALAQRERVFAGYDKNTCQAGDVIRFKAMVFRGDRPSFLSTTLYCQLYRRDGSVVTEGMFSLLSGLSVGQLVVPDTLRTGSYVLAAYTLQQLAYDSLAICSQPLVVYNREKAGPAMHYTRDTPQVIFTAGVEDHVRWISYFMGDSLHVQVMADSVRGDSLSLHVARRTTKDSALRADLLFTRDGQEAFLSFAPAYGRMQQELFLENDSVVLGRHVLTTGRPRDSITVTFDTLDASPYGVNTWTVHMPDSALYFASVAVSDADRSVSPPVTVESLHAPYNDDFVTVPRDLDTSFLTFRGIATRGNRKPVKDPMRRSLMMMGRKDSTTVFMDVVKLDDSGRFVLDSVYLHGPFTLGYQYNTHFDPNSDLKVTLTPRKMPRLPRAFMDEWKEEGPLGRADTLQSDEEIRELERRHMGMLAPAIVKAWKDPSIELDRRYAVGVAFSEPSGTWFDMTTYTSEYNRDFENFLLSNVSRVKKDYLLDSFVDVVKHAPIKFFLNEVPCDIYTLKAVPFDLLAYIKVLESDFTVTRPDAKLVSVNTDPPKTSILPPMYPDPAHPPGNSPGPKLKLAEWKTPLNILVWTRKGKDFRSMPGGMQSAEVEGYTPVRPFVQDRVTLFWNPYAVGHDMPVRFVNSEHARRFRIVVEAVTYQGKTVHLEKVVGAP